ncbi:MAG TPA: VWA domain-containing protein [Bryobacteraceae bacterium]|jgi:Flp pilus assembly protein TadG
MREPSSDLHRRERGATLILLTLALALVVIPLVGIAIDGTTLYLVRLKLSQAVDAAALSGARSLSTGLDLASQSGSASATALTYFQANFPDGFMGTSYTAAPTISVTQNSTMSRIVLVQASVVVPLTFMRVAGFQTSTVSEASQATRRDVNLMLVLDKSSSMQSAGVCPTMVANAQAFVNRFADGRDILGLITFNQAANVDFHPSTTFKSSSPNLSAVIGGVQCSGNTSSAMGLWQAYQQIQTVNQPGRLNVIVFFTDGRPNGITTTYPRKGSADTRYIYTNTSVQSASPASSCAAGVSLHGVIAQWAGDAATGATAGIFDPASGNAISASGCTFTGTAGVKAMTSDVAYIPGLDDYGNATTGYKTSALFPANSPYSGKIRPDTPPAIVAASTNAADNAARRIRADTNYNIVIFSLGLGGTDPEPLDYDFLRRVANDPASSSYDSTRPAGHFYYAADITQLSAAYQEIASQILRLSK